MPQGKRVERAEPQSIAEELMIGPGDEIIAINDTAPDDILDWHLAESCEEIVLVVRHRSGELMEYEIEKDYDESLGIVFESPTLDKIRTCQNRCVFCFVDQMPGEMRETLYIKDDDYRLSFLSGSYITLTNLKEEDLERITRLHLSPLYVSVHTTNPRLRREMMNHRKAGEILSMLTRLADAGITIHTQVVLCPGLNDGDELEKTIHDLFSLYPAVQSLAVVPVGLTGHRNGLYPLSPTDQVHAGNVLAQIARWQKQCLAREGTRFVFASDEFYTAAGTEIPPDEDYEAYLQLENGVGLVRLLLNEWDAWRQKLPQKIPHRVSAAVATGISASKYLQPVINQLNEIQGVDLALVSVENRFFGGHVTVAGLLTYSDLVPTLKKESRKERLYLPAVMLKEGRELFLDGYTINDLALTLQTEIRIVDSLDEFVTDLLELEMR